MSDEPAPSGMRLADPALLLHRYDPDADSFHFVAADRARRSAAVFLTDAYLPGHDRPIVLDRRAALAAAPAPGPLHFVLHAAFCCSTLVARAFDRPGLASTLKEPVVLNDLVGWRHRGAPPALVAERLDQALRLLARPFEPGEAVLVKPSNVVNALAPAMLAMRPDAQAIFLHAPLGIYLTSIARKGMWGRLWARDLLAKQILDGIVDLGFAGEDYLRLTDIQAAAVGWIAQAALFARLAARFPGRIRSLDSEQLLARPREALQAIATLFHMRLDADEAATIQAEVFGLNAKDGARYDAVDRTREQVEGAALHADETDKVLVWADAVARSVGVSLTLPAPLLG